MATEAEILEHIIEPMARIYGRPFGCRTDKEADMAQAEYLRTLTGIPLEALKEGWADIRREWTKRTWPTPAEMYQAAKPHIPRARPSQRSDMRVTPFHARQLLNTTPEGDLAYRLKVPASFIAFSVREGRGPDETEVRRMAAARFTAEEVPQICAKVHDPAMRPRLEALGRDIVQRNEQLCEENERA